MENIPLRLWSNKNVCCESPVLLHPKGVLMGSDLVPGLGGGTDDCWGGMRP